MRVQIPNMTSSILPEYERRDESDDPAKSEEKVINSKKTVLVWLSVFLAAIYVYYFVKSLPLWFHPGWTTDDALQQWFPFIELLKPGTFKGDLIYEVMSGYLAPLHYSVCAIATYLTGDPIVASHWVMLVQLLLSVFFLFGAVNTVAGRVPAIFSVLWLLHTRQIVQRFTAGLPRGWSGVVIPAFFYFAAKRNHVGVMITLFLGCLCHPPTTLICAGAYGIWLLKEVTIGDRKAFLKPFLVLICLSPIYGFVTWKVVERPESVGQMVSYEEASEMPQFQDPTGRFPFLPHPQIIDEWEMYAFQAFTGRFYQPVKFLRKNIRKIVLLAFGLLLLYAWARKREAFPFVFFAFFLSLTAVYLLSRPLAFKLYVPNRHLQFPMAFFWITVFPIVVWRVLHVAQEAWQQRDSSLRLAWRSALGLVLLGSFIWAGSSTGLIGSANFNYSRTKKGNMFEWLQKHSPQDSLVAGHPKLIDGVMLFGERRAYATNETYHPFYSGYLKQIEKRLEVTFRAHYAKELSELYELLEPEGVDYFVFDRKKFYPESLKKEKYYPPLDKIVKELTSDDPSAYAYKKIPRKVDLKEAPYQVYRDQYAVVIDIAALGRYLAAS